MKNDQILSAAGNMEQEQSLSSMGNMEQDSAGAQSCLHLMDAYFPGHQDALWTYDNQLHTFTFCWKAQTMLGLTDWPSLPAKILADGCLQPDRFGMNQFLEDMDAARNKQVDVTVRFPLYEGHMTTLRFQGQWVGEGKREVHGEAVYAGVLLQETDAGMVNAGTRVFSDPLTELPPRSLFLHRVNGWLATWEPGRMGWMGSLNLNRYRRIRHLYGEKVADALILTLAERLAAIDPDLLVARAGGDEFLLAWKGPSEGFDSDVLAASVMSLFQLPWELEGLTLAVSAALGHAAFPAVDTSAEQVLMACESAAVEAQSAGGACVRAFTGVEVERVLRRNELEKALRLEWDSPAFSLVYQPIYDMEVERYIGVEALARWKGLEVGTVSPGEFIPIAEESGLIVPLGYRILRMACMAGVALNAGGRRMTVSVNASSLQLAQPDFGEQVMEILSWSGLPAERLQIEVTESLMVQGEQRVSEVLGSLMAKGIRIALDDFGTGYSSLSYLKRLPLHVLKIDRAFVVNLVENRMEKAIARSIISLSNILGLDVVAEGVETQEQMDTLRSIGCTRIQGYHTGRPQPLEQMLEQLSRDTYIAHKEQDTIPYRGMRHA